MNTKAQKEKRESKKINPVEVVPKLPRKSLGWKPTLKSQAGCL